VTDAPQQREAESAPRLCVRCSCCSEEWVDCCECGGEGTTLPGDLYEEDPCYYDPEDVEPCHMCRGTGGGYVCLGRCDNNGMHAVAVGEGERAP